MRFEAITLSLFAAALLSAVARPAQAQALSERVVISVSGASVTGTSEITSTVAFTANAEKGSYSYRFPVKPKPFGEVSARIRLIKNFGVSVGYTSVSANGTAEITGQIPHPFFFNQLRPITGQASLEHTETAVHVRATLSSAPGKKLQFSVSAGPTFFSVKQGLVDSVSWTDSYPYDTATFASAATKQVSQSATGFGAGADVAYYFSKHLGIGASASVAKATVSGTASDNSVVSIDVGGTSLGFGVRLRF